MEFGFITLLVTGVLALIVIIRDPKSNFSRYLLTAFGVLAAVIICALVLGALTT